MSSPSEEKFSFNENTKKYVFFTEKKFGKNLIFDLSKIDNIIKAYSNYDNNPLTIKEIAIKFKLSSDVVKHILITLGITHDSVPFSQQTLNDSDESYLVDEMIASKEHNILHKFEKAEYEKVKNDAEKWNLFNSCILHPFEDFLEKWNPPKYVPKNYSYKKPSGNKVLCIGASDWHYGLVANERYLYNQKEWNIDKTKEAVASYAAKLKQHIQERNNPYKELQVLFLGDLAHTLSGFTDKGTKLEVHPLGEEQLEEAFNSCLLFVEELLSVHNNIIIRGVSGNHSALGDYVLVKMLSLYFRNDKRIKFDLTNKRHLLFKIYDNLFLMEHGYSSITKNRLPENGKSRETYINNLFLSKTELLNGIKRKYYCSADQHHSETYELTNVEGIMFPTLVGGCRYADNSGYKSRPRQTSLVVTDEGVVEILHFYFD